MIAAEKTLSVRHNAHMCIEALLQRSHNGHVREIRFVNLGTATYRYTTVS
jgi:hypothetical protein